jgi:hypothetical protein
MAIEKVAAPGGSLTLQVDVITLAGTLGVGNEAGLYAYYYHGGAGSYSTVNRTRVGSTAQQKLVVPVIASASGVIVVGDAATLAVQQFQVFPSGPIVGEALRVWFVAPKPDGTVSTTAPTAVWSLDGSADSAVTVVAGANAGFWYVDLTTGQTNATSGRLLVTGTGVVPTSIPILFTTTASGGGGGTGEDEENMIPDAIYVRSTSTSWTTDANVVAGDKVRLTPGRTGDEIEYWVVGSSARAGDGVPVPATGRIVTVPTGGVLQYRSLAGTPTLRVEVQNA